MKREIKPGMIGTVIGNDIVQLAMHWHELGIPENIKRYRIKIQCIDDDDILPYGYNIEHNGKFIKNKGSSRGCAWLTPEEILEIEWENS